MLGQFPRARRPHAAQDDRTASAAPAAPSGPGAWPTAFVDELGFTFWPDDYAQKIRARGFDVIATAVVSPPRRPEHGTTTGSAAADAQEPCAGTGNSEGAWLAGRIEQTITLTGDQHAALEALKSAVDRSMAAVRNSCEASVASSPDGRTGALIQQLWTLRDAGIGVRGPLKAFYDSLTADQKAKFAAKSMPEQSNTANADMKRQYQACAAPSLESSQRMLSRIEQEVRPTQQQAASFDALRKTSTDMARLLTASCTKPIPADPMARLDAADDRVSTMSYAATSMQIALDSLRAQLDDKQKEKFDSIGQ
jgi:hypothetical protein